MDLQKTQKEIYQNKVERGFNVSDIGKEIILIIEEVGELSRSFRDKNKEEMVDAVGDIMIYCLGLCEILGVDSEKVIQKIVDNNKKRTHRSHFKEKR